MVSWKMNERKAFGDWLVTPPSIMPKINLFAIAKDPLASLFNEESEATNFFFPDA